MHYKNCLLLCHCGVSISGRELSLAFPLFCAGQQLNQPRITRSPRQVQNKPCRKQRPGENLKKGQAGQATLRAESHCMIWRCCFRPMPDEEESEKEKSLLSKSIFFLSAFQVGSSLRAKSEGKPYIGITNSFLLLRLLSRDACGQTDVQIS